MIEYRLDSEEIDNCTIWYVWLGKVTYGDFIKDKIVYSNKSIADCYSWIKANKEGLILTNTYK